METKSETAVDLFANKGFLCSQAVLESHSIEYGVDTIVSRKISAAFGGGMGHCDEVCGAVSGALMLIGLKYGQFKEGDNNSRINTYEHTKDFIKKFRKEFGSVKCTELLKYNLSKEEELLEARESGIFKSLCPKLVKRAVELIEDILEAESFAAKS